MRQIDYDFVELETDESFKLLAKSFGGILQSNTIRFDNPSVKGELTKTSPENGLWIRKWKLTTLQKIVLHRNPAPKDDEKKYSLVYFLNPSIFDLKKRSKKVTINSKCNNLFFSNQVMMDFSVLAKQPFYVVDITFTASWLIAQFNDANDAFKRMLSQCLDIDPKTILMKPCTSYEYQILHEMEDSIDEACEEKLFIRSRTYQLICSFFKKVFTNENTASKHTASRYEQIIQAERLIMGNLRSLPSLRTIAKMVNMSISVLVRHFKSVYGKSIQEYYLEKKMEVAKKMILENEVSINRVAEDLGYKQASPFIQTFTKRFGRSPGSLKQDKV